MYKRLKCLKKKDRPEFSGADNMSGFKCTSAVPVRKMHSYRKVGG